VARASSSGSGATGDLVLHNAMDYPSTWPTWTGCCPSSRVGRGGGRPHGPLSPLAYRKLTSWVHYRWSGLFFRVKLRDMNFVQVYKKEVLDRVR